jgi:N-methylhydantoinase B
VTSESTASHGDGSSAAVTDVDPVRTEVIRHGLVAAADQMGITLRRTAFSPVIYEITDFAAALYDREIRLLAQARALPLFLGTFNLCIEASVAKLGGPEVLEPGDVIFSTYGYDIGSHQQDATVIVPGFHEGELVGYAAVKAHHMDIGAKEPYCTDTVDIFQEGVIFPSVRLYRRGERQDDLYRTVLANTRMPEAFAGDLAAQIGSAQAGLAGLNRVIERYGVDQFRESVERMLDHGDTLIRSFFDKLPDGRYVGHGAMDSNGVSDDEIPFEVAVEVSGSDVVIDFTNSPPEQPGPVNCPLAAIVSVSRAAILSIAGGGESANEGHFRSLQVRTTPGTMFDPKPPAPIYLYSWAALQALDVIHRALADAMPEAVPAMGGGDLGAVVWWGKEDDGTVWGDVNDHHPGQGASAHGDGGSPLMHISCSGIRNSPVEVLEARGRVISERFELSPDSGGAGKFRGGLGVDNFYRALRDFYVTLPWERTKNPPWGLHGGGPARPARIELEFPDGTTRVVSKATGVFIPAGTLMKLMTGGGGGWGEPAERDPAAVAADVREGYVTEAAARRDYPQASDALVSLDT